MNRFSVLLAAAALTLSANAASAQNLPADEAVLAANTSTAMPAAAPATAKAAAPAVRTVYVDQNNQLSLVTMSTRNDMAVFAGLEGMNNLRATVTNSEGREFFSAPVDGKRNCLKISSLKPGLYYITLVNGNTAKRRAFVLNR